MDFAAIYHLFSFFHGEIAAFICFCDDCSSVEKTPRKKTSIAVHELARGDVWFLKFYTKKLIYHIYFRHSKASSEHRQAEASFEVVT